jgi:hypothetical protein
MRGCLATPLMQPSACWANLSGKLLVEALFRWAARRVRVRCTRAGCRPSPQVFPRNQPRTCSSSSRLSGLRTAAALKKQALRVVLLVEMPPRNERALSAGQSKQKLKPAPGPSRTDVCRAARLLSCNKQSRLLSAVRLPFFSPPRSAPRLAAAGEGQGLDLVGILQVEICS